MKKVLVVAMMFALGACLGALTGCNGGPLTQDSIDGGVADLACQTASKSCSATEPCCAGSVCADSVCVVATCKDMKPCPNNQSYQTCMTTGALFYLASDGMAFWCQNTSTTCYAATTAAENWCTSQ